MILPNSDKAIIEKEKLVVYLLNPEDKRGGTKARILNHFGYRVENWQQLESDIRRDHLKEDIDMVRTTIFGKRYEIHAPLQTPIGRGLIIRSVWQIDKGTHYPRLITLFPD